jgi:hypothetical protein
MSNIIKMEVQQSVKLLKSKGWSDHHITRELGINRRTVKRYASGSKCTNPHTGKKGPVSQCEPHRDRIKKPMPLVLQEYAHVQNLRPKAYHLLQGHVSLPAF